MRMRLQENLEKYGDCPNYFLDKKSGFIFTHDKESFENEYEVLRCKYDRRINKFMQMTKERVCFLRRIEDEAEILYIITNEEYIRSVIRKNNPNNDIIFLCDGMLSMPDKFPFKYFRMKKAWDGSSRKALGSYFDNADDFLNFCGENILGTSLIRNSVFARELEEKHYYLTEYRYKILTGLLAHDFSKDVFPSEVIIYGAGALGMELYRKIKNYTKVKCFIDMNKAGTEFEKVKIISVDDLKYEKGIEIIVSTAYDFAKIKDILSTRYSIEDIVSLEDIIRGDK